MFRAIATLLFLVVLTFPPLLTAQDVKWFALQSDHFVVYTDTSEAKGRRLLVDLEGRVGAFAQLTRFTPRSPFPIEVFLFNQDRDFLEAAPRIGTTAPNRNAYVIKGPDRAFIVAKDKSPEDIADHAGHALGHLLFDRQVLWRPFWLSEAVAEYVRKAGRDADGRKVSAEDVYSVRDLLTIVPSSTYDDTDSSSTFRLQAYRLLRILLDDNRAALRDYFRAIRTEEGMNARVSNDAAAYDAKLSGYMETPLKGPVPDPAIRTVAADPAAVAVHRGDLMLATGRTADAAMLYNGDSNEARAARAILNRFNRGPVEALRSLERVAREQPDSGLVQYHFGAIETQTPKDIASQVAALERAVTLLPDFGPAHAELARVYVLSGNANKAMPHVLKAVELSPEMADRIYEIRADVHTALGEFDEAFRVIKIAEALPHADRATAEKFGLRVRSLLGKIEMARRDLEDKRLQEIRRDVAGLVSEREPRPVPAPPPPPVPEGLINYEIEARSRVEVVDAVFPEYPEALRRQGAAGRISLRVDIGPDGRVKAATVAASQLPALNAAAIEAVKKWSFRTASPTGASIRLNFSFLLQ